MESLEVIQRACCEHYGAIYTPTDPEQLVVISDGVYEEGMAVEGVRYSSPSHMTGWWLTTERCSGNIDLLQTVHFRHIEEQRPDIARYMALPYGYRFQLGGKEEHVWFDAKAAEVSK